MTVNRERGGGGKEEELKKDKRSGKMGERKKMLE